MSHRTVPQCYAVIHMAQPSGGQEGHYKQGRNRICGLVCTVRRCSLHVAVHDVHTYNMRAHKLCWQPQAANR
jgi:hypothetical protein